MGIELTHSPKYWRMRAEEFRAKADNCEHSEAKESLRSAAKAYDQLARSAEQISTVKDYAATRPSEGRTAADRREQTKAES